MRWPSVNRHRHAVHYVTVADTQMTADPLPAALAARGVAFRCVSWESLFRRRPVPRGTWILTDFDRLSPAEHEFAARFHHGLTAAGLPVLNDPGLFRPRGALLRYLHGLGINRFTVWRPADGEWPDRFPALLRTEVAHRGAFGDLVHDRSQAEIRLAQAPAAGHVLADLLFVEYAAEPVAETGRFQKHAVHRIGPAIVRAPTVNDAGWHAKRGTLGAATPDQYRAELAEVDDYPHADWARRVFDLAGIGFVRIDFAIVGGAPQVYEINTNPTMRLSADHPSPERVASLARMGDLLVEAFAAVASDWKGPPVPIRGAGRRGATGRGSLLRA